MGGFGLPVEDDGRCIGCGAEIGHYNGCIEDPEPMCLCHLCMGDQAVTSEDDCPFHGDMPAHGPLYSFDPDTSGAMVVSIACAEWRCGECGERFRCDHACHR